VLTLSRGRVAEAVRRTGKRYRFGDALVAGVAEAYGRDVPVSAPPPSAAPAPGAASESGEDEQVRFGLVALTQREREIVLDHFDARTISRETVEEMLGDAGQLLDRTRTHGRAEYLQAAAEVAGFSRTFRFAHLLHRRFHIDAPLVDALADRFEQLLVSRIVLDELSPYLEDTVAPLVGERASALLRDLLKQRDAMATAALEALRAQYPDYATLLEQRFLRRVALRRQDVEYRTLFEEHVIGPELYGALEREVKTARAVVDVRPQLDLGLETRALIARVPLFADLDHAHLDALARHLRPRFAVPDERLISTGDPGDSMYFISSGVVEVDAAGQRILLTRGDFFGEMALVLNQPRQADVTARSYCQLLVLQRQDFQSLLRSSRAIRAQIDQAVAERAKMNSGLTAQGSGLTGLSAQGSALTGLRAQGLGPARDSGPVPGSGPAHGALLGGPQRSEAAIEQQVVDDLQPSADEERRGERGGHDGA
jgi:CPA1 family monovalent cation:H+ antiporter